MIGALGGLADFLAMGGYGAYVWPAYALAAVVLAGLAVHSVRSLRANEHEVRSLEGDAPHRRRAGDAESGR